MKYFITGLLVLFALQLFSQTYLPQLWQEGKKPARLVESPKSNSQPKAVFLVPGIGAERMPVAVTENKGVFQGNNGKGFDIYSMKHDNMPCLVPDSSFHAHLPGASLSKNKNLQKPR